MVSRFESGLERVGTVIGGITITLICGAVLCFFAYMFGIIAYLFIWVVLRKLFNIDVFTDLPTMHMGTSKNGILFEHYFSGFFALTVILIVILGIIICMIYFIGDPNKSEKKSW